ncbi:MAG: zinc ribbon domain-containing protein [Candidatus Marinimicrobia bacterium]|nr:zinc ribbon domain-containing protein [Candidatus Neomarinimicrobiota bacterium]MBL7010029.1 zinc ribbon domain-containing protein [Candidatus Neomarinimicrobiota bacterium]MBL7030298.1 zinc ribbon domain-containing protein [Candidatus Neomarinimicrobiota bacterium]
MPTYDYKCQKCDHIFEFFQTMSDLPLTNCPECTGKVRRLVSGGSGLIFKGSGFYLTDYAKKNSNEKKTEKSTKTGKKKPVKESTKS